MEYKLKQLLNFIKNNKSLIEITHEMGISYEEIYYLLEYLKKIGLIIKANYYDDGNIYYKILETTYQHNYEILMNNKNKLTIMAISDQHYGNINEEIEATYKIYQYCLENEIHIILNGGDLVDGISERSLHKSGEDQILYALNNYPYNNHIINFITLGNHDSNTFDNSGNSIANILKLRRPDIVPLGYGCGIIKIKNDNIFLTHSLKNKHLQIPNVNRSLHLMGHSHYFKIISSDNMLALALPTLSSITADKKNNGPAAIKIHIVFSNDTGTIETVTIEHLLVRDKIYSILVKTFEIKPKIKEKSKQIIHSMSPIEKFNTRFI